MAYDKLATQKITSHRAHPTFIPGAVRRGRRPLRLRLHHHHSRTPASVAAQLISRHWIITDSNNHVQEVRGCGVVGEQPLLRPSETFEYTSGTAIATPVGTMRGSYQMVGEDGVEFDAPIPEFTLSMPRVLH